MYDPQLNKFGRYLWVVVAFIFSSLFFIYFYDENQSLIPLSVCPLVMVLIWLMVGRASNKTTHYYPKNLKEYIVENAMFFAMYIALHLLLKDKYTTLQAIYVVCMIAIVTFDTYALARVVKSVGT